MKCASHNTCSMHVTTFQTPACYTLVTVNIHNYSFHKWFHSSYMNLNKDTHVYVPIVHRAKLSSNLTTMQVERLNWCVYCEHLRLIF